MRHDATLKSLVVAILAALYYYYREIHVGSRGQVPLLTLGRPYGFSEHDIPDLAGKVFIVTGANSGLGRATSKLLAGRGGATVIMACRSEARGKRAAKEVAQEILSWPQSRRRESTGGELIFMRLDLSSFASVRAFAQEFSQKYDRLDGLINNAAVMGIPKLRLSEDGIEMHFAVNHVGHALLTDLMLPSIRAAGAGSRVVIVSSTSQHLQKTVPTKSLEDINNEDEYSPYMYYSRSKLSNTLFCKELSRRLDKEDIFVNCLDPGGVGSNILGNTFEQWGIPKAWAEAFYNTLGATNLFVWHSETAALTPLYLATSPKIVEERIQGKFFLPIAEQWPTHHPAAEDEKLAADLWSFTSGLYGGA